MSLSLMESFLLKKGASFEKYQDGIVLVRQRGVNAPVYMTQERHGWIELEAAIHMEGKAKPIEDLDQFVIEVEKILGPTSGVMFDSEDKAFLIRHIFDGDDVADELEEFLFRSDNLTPLFHLVFATGKWGPALISLMTTAAQGSA